VKCAAQAAAGLVEKLITAVAADPLDDDTIFTGGIFIFVAANHFSLLIGASFEQASSLELLILTRTPEEFGRL
jgi:hypothetical protein